ncbi:TIGR03767 family metallophosphoesterase [Solihabitans fulvus]|uniref:TIGR03767 family metallophosphoesterase n=1 Tax=Solihabitans fulvus TaxID=1892852 RepID=A0A5B2WNZ7_9PSEU|nr:TIGR03767 family metallophosphoesterase [Solihabitans fulvus]KAA2252540.1 TIGR03767 family metallophosphoesterase [Solihabitans fulvus]
MDTARRRIVRAGKDDRGYQRLLAAPGEPHVVREDLAAAAPGRGDTRVSVLAFAHLSDLHVMDAQSPTRVEFLERHADPDSLHRQQVPAVGTYRPQEMFTTHVAEAMVRAVNDVPTPLAFAISTGDATDACQANELRNYLAVLDGGTVRPGSGDPNRWEGVHASDPATYDTRYWHPDGTPEGCADDLPRAAYGYPTAPGALAAAAKPFQANGLSMPWYAVHGNHDNMVQGTVPPTVELARATVGTRKAVGLPEGADELGLLLGLASAQPSAVAALAKSPMVSVTADPERRHVTRTEWVAEHLRSDGKPRGHGFGDDNVADGTAYYAFDSGVVRGLVLDTVNPHGHWEGSLDLAQFEWLEDQLRAGSRRHLAEDGSLVDQPDATDRLFVLFSHHPLDSLVNDNGSGRLLAEPMLRLLLRFPNVVLWVNGHTHTNTVRCHRRAENAVLPGGFWQVTTASHIDWPQQARVVELLDNRDGSLSIVGTVLDHVGPLAWTGEADPIALAALSRELAANYWQTRDNAARESIGAGTPSDRNVELLLPHPFG